MDLKELLHQDSKSVDPGQGELLLAAPLMLDPHFRRSAVLILDREDNGSHMGLALNRRLDASMADLFSDWEQGSRLPLYMGGPVGTDRLFMLHKLPQEIGSTAEIFPGIYAGADFELLKEYVAAGGETEGMIRFFLGYSGWGAGQLPVEILNDSWAVNPHPDVTTIFDGETDAYWRREVGRLGPEFRSWLIVPEYPSLN